MGSGMNCEQAKEYAKTMTYKQAVGNVMSSKGIKYRKATMIKLRELAEIADRLDRIDSEKPNNFDKDTNVRSKYDCETCRHWWVSEEVCLLNDCQYEPEITVKQTSPSTVAKTPYDIKDEPQTERSE